MSKLGSNALQPGGSLNELKNRLIFLFFGILIYRIGCHVPVPGVDTQQLLDLFKQNKSGVLDLFNMFSGGALQNLAVFALGVMPYISASIIMQLLSAVSPKLEQLKKEGEAGQRKINQYTRYATVFLSAFQAIGACKLLVSKGFVIAGGSQFYVVATLTLVAGTMFLMWLGEQMTERGVGNGISMIIFAGIVSNFPMSMGQLFQQVKQGQMQGIFFLLLISAVVLVTAFVVFIERGQRRIVINYAKRSAGSTQSSYLPLKINMAGVIPPIFASSILLFPMTLFDFFSGASQISWLGNIRLALMPGQPIYLLLFGLLIVFFCFFYAALVFNPKETAEQLKKSSAFIPGIRPGEQTALYIDSVASRLTFVGAIYLVLISLLPQFLVTAWNVPFQFGGTSLLIVVVVIMDFIAQLQAHLLSHQYNLRGKKMNLLYKG